MFYRLTHIDPSTVSEDRSGSVITAAYGAGGPCDSFNPHGRENVCVCGPCGTGKSHFCEALGQAAVEAGMTVAWFRMNWPLTRGAWVASAQHGDLVAEHQQLGG